MSPSPGRWAAIGAAVLGLAGWAGAIYLALDARAEYADADVADGVVSRLNAGGSHPEIEFTTPRGATVSYPQGGMIGGYQPGDHVRVLYHAADPKRDPTIDAVGAKYGFAPFVAQMATLPLVVGLAMLIWLVPVNTPERIRRRLRWVETGTRATTRPQLIRVVLTYCATVAFVLLAVGFGDTSTWTIALAIGSAAYGTYLLLVRSTQIAFAGQTLVVDSGRFGARVALNTHDIASFAAQREVDGSHVVIMIPKAGPPIVVPIALESLKVSSRGMVGQTFPAPLEYAEFVAARMALMLDGARRAAP